VTNHDSGLHVRWIVIVAGSFALVTFGAVGTYLWMRTSARTATSTAAAPERSSAPAGGQADSGQGATAPAASRLRDRGPLSDVELTLTEDAVRQAGITVARVRTSSSGGTLRLPGVVQPNAYRSVSVTSLVGGRVTRVLAELGQSVRRGQTLAELYSPELAEAQMRFISARAELSAHERELARTEKLTEIGAASRQELERIHAEHTSATTVVESARSRLTLLGMSAPQIDKLTEASDLEPTSRIEAPADGIVTARDANAGLNVNAGTPLFTVVDLSTVWVVGELYEKDFSNVRLGSAAQVTTTAYADMVLDGKVSYIDSQVRPETRTAQVRVEIPNREGRLRLGMFAEMQVTTPGKPVVTVPRTAVQMVDDRSVVYLANASRQGHFVEREVHVGNALGEDVEVIAGVGPDDLVVEKGSFSLRAERERLGLRPASGAANPGAAGAGAPSTPPSTAGIQTGRVEVTEQGYQPDRVTLRAGVPARITFIRTTDKTCGTEVTIPSLGIERPLPLNQPVDIEFTPQKTGDIGFVCGMGMLKGTLAVQ
jgi:RND family efflux transporter MFP subunit